MLAQARVSPRLPVFWLRPVGRPVWRLGLRHLQQPVSQPLLERPRCELRRPGQLLQELRLALLPRSRAFVLRLRAFVLRLLWRRLLRPPGSLWREYRQRAWRRHLQLLASLLLPDPLRPARWTSLR